MCRSDVDQDNGTMVSLMVSLAVLEPESMEAIRYCCSLLVFEADSDKASFRSEVTFTNYFFLNVKKAILKKKYNIQNGQISVNI